MRRFINPLGLSWVALTLIALAGSASCFGNHSLAAPRPPARRAVQKASASVPFSPVEMSGAVTVARKAKPHRTPPPHRPKLAPLLSMQWWVLKRAPDGKALEANPASVFREGDKLQLGVKTNQTGYLYIVLHNEGKENGRLIYPNPRIDGGQNEIRANVEKTVPTSCPEFADPRDCWLQLAGSPDHEVFTVVFSRDRLDQLSALAGQPGGSVTSALLEELRHETVEAKDLRRTVPKATAAQRVTARDYVTRVTNTNRADNEEIMERIVISHQK